MTFEEWYARDDNHKIVENQTWWRTEEVKMMLEASWCSAYEVCEIEKDGIINFLKKELIKKTYCRQVMKKQYRELKQKYDALLKKSNPVDTRFNDFANGVQFGRFIGDEKNGKEKGNNED